MIIASCVTCMEQHEAFFTGSAILSRSSEVVRNRKNTWLMLCTFDDLASRILPEARAALMNACHFREGADLRLHPLRGVVLSWFAEYLPRESLLIFLDNFLIKGRKIFFRYGLAILRRWYRTFIDLKDQGIDSAFLPCTPEDIVRSAHDARALADEAFSFSFSTKDIERSEKAAHIAAWNGLAVNGLVSGVDELSIQNPVDETDLQQISPQSLELYSSVDIAGEEMMVYGGKQSGHKSWQEVPLPRNETDFDRLYNLKQKARTSDYSSASKRIHSSRRIPVTSTRKSNLLRRIQQHMQTMFMLVYSEFAQTKNDGASLDVLSSYTIPRDVVDIQNVLGQGAFGTVSRAKIRPNEKTELPKLLQRVVRNPDVIVAVKSVLPSAETEEQAKFLLEASLMVSLRHKHLVAMLGVCHSELPYLLILEYMENGNCRSYVRKCRQTDGPENLSQDKVQFISTLASNFEISEPFFAVYRTCS